MYLRVFFSGLLILMLWGFKASEVRSLAIIENPGLNDSTLFDFWLGDWDAVWFEKDSLKAYGENHLTREFNGYVIHEDFKIHSGNSAGFVGGSWSMYDKNKQKWFQTWVDNSGSYMTFEAKLEGPNRIFERSTINKKGIAVIQRMVFKNITKNSFTWDWESSVDNGKSWNMNWQIFYTRKK
jgi:hypothetical protein